MSLKKLLLICLFLCSFTSELFSQTTFNLEYVLGKTSPANEFFPELKVNQTVSLFVGKKHFSNESIQIYNCSCLIKFRSMNKVEAPLEPQQTVCSTRIVTITLALFYKKKHRTNFSHLCWCPCYCCVCIYVLYIVSLFL